MPRSHNRGEITPPCSVPLLRALLTTILEVNILFTHTTRPL
uniref:Uncharacterized protein n=1 Tax=Megaselia scalaris TaxID=36166 RepID=T1H1A0_MEGSC